MKSSFFQIDLKLYLKVNQKVITIILSTYDKPSLNMQKQLDQIVLWLEIGIQLQNFKGRNPPNFWVAIWKIGDFINSFWLYLTFTKHSVYVRTERSFLLISFGTFYSYLADLGRYWVHCAEPFSKAEISLYDLRWP